MRKAFSSHHLEAMISLWCCEMSVMVSKEVPDGEEKFKVHPSAVHSPVCAEKTHMSNILRQTGDQRENGR